MFDLPTDTRQARREYARFRKSLKNMGFKMLQFSVYGKHFPCEETSLPYRKRIRAIVPPGGQVSVLGVTDHQFSKMETYIGGKKSSKKEESPPQLMLF